MVVPDVAELEKAARKIVQNGKKDGKLSTLTPRIVREEVERLFTLDVGTLSTKEYKQALKDAVNDEATRRVDNVNSVDFVPPHKKNDEAMGKSETPEKVAKSHTNKPRSVHQGSPDGNTTKKKRKSDANQDSEDKKERSPKKPKNEPVKEPKPSKSGNAGKTKIGGSKDTKVFKSSAIVQSSDVDEDDMGAPIGHVRKTSEYCVESENETESPKAVDGGRRSSQGPIQYDLEKNDNSSHEASESELSVLIDEPPKKGKKGKGRDKEPRTGEKKRRQSSAELTKDEKTITRLKSLVAACGVRKLWAKEFELYPKPSQRIRRLKEILSDLGMAGRFTIQQAKAIKEKRELAQELEDVQSFERSVMSSRPTRARGKAKPVDMEGEGAASVSEAEEVPTKRKGNARMSIMAFLGDQSESE